MNTKQTLFALALSSVLVACGSSSSGNNNQGASPVSSANTEIGDGNTNDENTNSENASGGNTNSETKPITGVLVKKDSTDTPVWDSLSEHTINTVTINGTSVELLPADYNGKEFYKYMGDDGKPLMIISGLSYQYSRFGAIDDDIWGVFAHGEPTEVMPDAITHPGISFYKGDAVGVIEGISTKGFVAGSSYFYVDFALKTVHGGVDGWEANDMPSLEFDATINGNTFEGGGAKGQFFGPNAAELGGVLNTKHNGKIVGASFGAKMLK